MSFKRTSIILGAIFCVVVLTTIQCLGNPIQQQQQQSQKQNSKQQQQQQPSNDNQDEWTFASDGSLFLAGNECGPDEKLVPGALPTCEPTCQNPRPICPKVFFTSLDVVPCFCKEPLVRNEQTRQCVPLNECPKASPDKIPNQKF